MIGTTELIIIFGVVVLLFGSSKIPELAKGIGSAMGEFKKARTEFEKPLKEETTNR